MENIKENGKITHYCGVEYNDGRKFYYQITKLIKIDDKSIEFLDRHGEYFKYPVDDLQYFRPALGCRNVNK